MSEYCTEYNPLTSKNSGFKKNNSTVNRLLSLTHKIYQSLGDGSDVLLIFLDVAKAFDKVHHSGLLHKLQSFGITGDLLEWLRRYLNRYYLRIRPGSSVRKMTFTNLQTWRRIEDQAWSYYNRDLHVPNRRP